MKILIKSTVWK